MGRTNYERGVEKERLAIEQLEEVGYIAFRTAGSHSPIDVIGIGPTGVRLIQTKRIKKDGSWKSEYKVEVEKLKLMPKLINVSYEYWIWRDYEGWIKQEVIKC